MLYDCCTHDRIRAQAIHQATNWCASVDTHNNSAHVSDTFQGEFTPVKYTIKFDRLCKCNYSEVLGTVHCLSSLPYEESLSVATVTAM